MNWKPFPGCDIRDTELDLRRWQSLWEERLEACYAGVAASTSSRSVIGFEEPGDLQNVLSEQFSRFREGHVKAIHQACNMVKKTLNVSLFRDGMAEGVWSKILTVTQREYLILYSL